MVAAAAATRVVEKVQEKDVLNNKKTIPSILGQATQISSTEHATINAEEISSESYPFNPRLTKKEGPCIAVGSFKNVILPTEVRQLDAPVLIKKSGLKNMLETPHLIPTEKSSKVNIEPLTLLNAIKPVDLDWHKQVLQPRLLLQHYMSLSKIRLTGLVVLTTAAGYGMACAPFEPLIFLYALLGTAFMSASANTINQLLEIPYDSQMARTKNRVLIRGLLTPLHAATFAAVTSTAGLCLLYFGVNAITAGLGAANLILYTSVYTPLKRCSILNTWVGSVVGAIPPVMGWAACTGSLNASALLMGAILFSWQFPHFNALSWNLRPDYSRAGYRMMSVVNPELCRKTALRHSVYILLFCSAAPLVDLTTWSFAIDSFPFNCYFVYCTWKFYKNADSQTSRKLFRLSLLHLPGLIFLLYISKKQITKENIDLMNL